MDEQDSLSTARLMAGMFDGTLKESGLELLRQSKAFDERRSPVGQTLSEFRQKLFPSRRVQVEYHNSRYLAVRSIQGTVLEHAAVNEMHRGQFLLRYRTSLPANQQGHTVKTDLPIDVVLVHRDLSTPDWRLTMMHELFHVFRPAPTECDAASCVQLSNLEALGQLCGISMSSRTGWRPPFIVDEEKAAALFARLVTMLERPFRHDLRTVPLPELVRGYGINVTPIVERVFDSFSRGIAGLVWNPPVSGGTTRPRFFSAENLDPGIRDIIDGLSRELSLDPKGSFVASLREQAHSFTLTEYGERYHVRTEVFEFTDGPLYVVFVANEDLAERDCRGLMGGRKIA